MTRSGDHGGTDAEALASRGRLPAQQTAVERVEVDFAEQLAHKRDVLARAGVALPSDIRHVACDFTADDFGSTLPAALEAAGLERDAGALVVWEGVVGYLDDVAIDRTLAMIARPIARPCRLAFNYTTGRFTPESMATASR